MSSAHACRMQSVKEKQNLAGLLIFKQNTSDIDAMIE